MDNMDQQLFKIAYRFFRELQIPITTNSLKELLYTHPDYPSLAALSDVCKQVNIDHAAVETSVDKLIENGFPAIVHLYEKGGTFVILIDILHDKIKYFHPEKGVIWENRQNFLQKWSRIAFYAIKDNVSGESDFKLKYAQEILSKFSLPFFLLTFVMIIGYGIQLASPAATTPFLLLLIVKVIGWFICLQLVLHSFGESTSFINKVCHAGKHSNCDDVLNSRASMLFGLINMSDIGFVYFTGGIISMLSSIYTKNTQSVTTFLLLIALCCIPYIMFSIYYQAIKAKKWCPLCLSVLLVLLIENSLFVFFSSTLNFNIFNFATIGVTSLLFINTASIWTYLKPLLIAVKKEKEHEYKYLRMKRTPNIFNAQLNTSPSVEMHFSGKDVMIGAPNAPLIITSVVNTYCKPCAETHKKLNELLKKNSNQIRLNIRFMVSGKGEKEAIYLLELYYRLGVEKFKTILDEWFKKMDFEFLKDNYPLESIANTTKKIFEQQNMWCLQQRLTYTPTIFLNDKRMGIEYSIDDLPWLIENILKSYER